MRSFASHVRPSRRVLVTLATVVALFALMLPAGASVAGSTFDAGDGDLLLANASGPPDLTDWENAPALQASVDLPTGQTDNSFGEGTKEDTAVPTVVSGAIPNNKSDLTRLYVSHEKIGTSVFLYLAWERVQEPTGTTNMDFEFNKNKCTPGVDDGVDVCSSNGVTPTRTPGDVLIKYDLSQGGTNPVLGYHIWIDATNAPAGSAGANCESNNKYPCWDKAHAIAGNNFEASINTVPVTDPIAPGAPRTLSARTFGEAAINLVGANILPAPGQNCKSFGSAFLKSRASDSFTAAVKDFIAPLPVSVSNCGTLRIRKQTLPQLGSSSPSFGFSTTGGNQLDASFSLKDDGVYEKLLTEGSYSVTESGVGAGFGFKDLVCSQSGLGTSVSTDQSLAKASLTLTADGVVDCTFTNAQAPKLTVTKTIVPSSDTGKFNLQIDGSTAGTGANVGNNGTTGAVGVSIGSHTVGETEGTGATLSNYVTVIGGDCASDGTITLAAGDNKTCTITNTRKPTLTVNKVTAPTNDTGKFNLQIDGSTAGTGANVGNGGTTGAQVVSIGSHTVGETAGTGSTLGDYVAVIGGDCGANGSITLGAGDNKICTITNTRKPTLTVNKVCDPVGDNGKFDLKIDGSIAGSGDDAACGGSTGAVVVSIANHTVSEAAGAGTDLSNYTSVISGDCAANGSVTLAAGDHKTCTITNTAKPTLTVTKVCSPTGDGGKFDLRIDGSIAGSGDDAACGGSTGAVVVSIANHTVSEAEGAGTDLTNYTSVIGGDCAANGSVTLAAGDHKTCTITNTRKPTLTVTKVCNPTGDGGKFDLKIDGSIAGSGDDASCGGSTGAVVVSVDTHTVSEAAGAGTDLSNYTSVIGGDCAADGSITLSAGDNKTCTITNTRKPTLKVVKILDPSSDDGLFNLLIDGTEKATNVSDQGHTSKVVLGIGTHSVSETAGTGTSLADYRATFGGDCDENGNVNLAAGDDKTCTITNVRRTFKVIVLVCEGNTLYASTVTVDGADKVSLGPNGGGTLSDADLCGLGGAAYPNKVTGNHPANISISKQQLP